MGWRSTFVAALLVMLHLLAPGVAVAAAPTDELRDVFARVNRVLNDPGSEEKPFERLGAVLEIVCRVFAFREAAEVSLGREWRARTPAEQEEFVQLFAHLLERAFVFMVASQAKVQGGLEVHYLSETVARNSATVLTAVASKGGSPLPLEYRMIRRGDGWAIRDVLIDGVSIVSNFQAQFSRVIRDWSYGGLVDRMRAKVAPTFGPVVALRPALAAPASTSEQGAPSPATASSSEKPLLPKVPLPLAAPLREPSRPLSLAADHTPEPVTPNHAAQRKPEERPAPAPSRGEAPVARDTRGTTLDAWIANTPPPPTAVIPAPGLRYWIQVGAFKNEQTAQGLAARLRERTLPVWVGSGNNATDTTGPPLSRVRVGPFADQAKALLLLQELRRQGYAPFIVTERD